MILKLIGSILVLNMEKLVGKFIPMVYTLRSFLKLFLDGELLLLLYDTKMIRLEQCKN